MGPGDWHSFSRSWVLMDGFSRLARLERGGELTVRGLRFLATAVAREIAVLRYRPTSVQEVNQIADDIDDYVDRIKRNYRSQLISTIYRRDAFIRRLDRIRRDRAADGLLFKAVYDTVSTLGSNTLNSALRGRLKNRRLGLIVASMAPAAYPAALRTADARGLAGAIYKARGWHDMPILADAIEDAGCDDRALLCYMRDPRFPWHRGNSVVDFLKD